MEWQEWKEYFRKMRKGLEQDRTVYAVNRLQELGYTCKYNEEQKCIMFDFKGKKVMFYPYKGFFCGKTVKTGRGLHNLLKQVDKIDIV